jgi:hypothetical protein
MENVEKYNNLSREKKLELFIGLYNGMIQYNRVQGWAVYLEDYFMFFDSKPSHTLGDDSFEVSINELKEWIEGLK